MMGICNITSADLTTRALEMTRLRCGFFGIDAKFQQENAEDLTFPDGTFDHVNCQGVIHHTPNTAKAVAEIARVLKHGGTASVSVCYRNVFLRLWKVLRFFALPLDLLGAGLKGRGREGLFRLANADDMVRFYDGKENPIGKCYSKNQFVDLLSPNFVVEDIYYHYFPARAFPLKIPTRFHRWLDRHLPFMMYANIRKG